MTIEINGNFAFGKKYLSKPSYTCLFWLSEDYSTVTHTAGEVEFSKDDLAAGISILTTKSHDSFIRDSLSQNRGRVCLNNGKIEVWVGLRCPESAVGKIKDSLGLSKYCNDVEIQRDGVLDGNDW